MTLFIRLRRIWTGSIRRRLMLAICGVIITIMAAFVYAMVDNQRSLMDRRNLESGMAFADTLAVSSVSWVLANDLVGLQEVVEATRNYPELRYVMILAPDGRVLAHSDHQLVGRYVSDKSSLEFLAGSAHTREVAHTSSLIDVAAPIRASGTIIAWTRVGLGQDRSVANLRDVKRWGLYAGGVAILLAALLVFIVGRRLAWGLNDLVDVTRQVTAGNASARARVGEDELGALGAAFNTMADTLEQASRELRASEHELRELLADLPVAILIYMTDEPEGTIYYANEMAKQLLDIDPEVASSGVCRIWNFVHEDGTSVLPAEMPFVRVMETKQAVIGRICGVVTQTNSERRWLHINAYPDFDVDGKVRRVIISFLDITGRKKAEETLRQLSAAVEQSPVSVFITDTDGTIRYVNPTFCVDTGYTAEEIIGQNPRILSDSAQSHAEYRNLRNILEKGEIWRGTLRNKRKDGTPHWVESIIAPIRNATNMITQFVCIQQDITARKEAEQQVEYLAHHDALTGLPNRLMGRESMEWLMAHANRTGGKAALMFLDLDGFKRINDALGHTAGDGVLQEVALRLRRCIRRTDTIARQGGDEFLIMLSGVNAPDAIITVVQNILKQIARPMKIDEQELSVSGSLGIAVYPDDGTDWDTLIKKADIAMYAAKEASRNTYRFFTEQMKHSADNSLDICNKLRNALPNGELYILYQPQVSLKTGQIVGFEALLRWRNPELGVVSPKRFLHLAEESGVIVQIGEWMLHEACRQAVIWQNAGLPHASMAVNMSAVQFQSGAVIGSVLHALADSGLEPTSLELEITEAILLKDPVNVMKIISDLKVLGVTLSIDDFGTGFSGLAYLKQFSADKVKIDQSFVQELTTDANSAAIVTAIIQIARGLGLICVAEGVEDEATLDALNQLDCDVVQGHCYAEPMTVDQVGNFIRKFAAA
jgi:diguanylate cyclase (GGDEF)-like protein/PAS domain S-box-containing protein